MLGENFIGISTIRDTRNRMTKTMWCWGMYIRKNRRKTNKEKCEEKMREKQRWKQVGGMEKEKERM